MPEIPEAYQNTPDFNELSWSTDRVFIADCSYINFIVKCSVPCYMALRWYIDLSGDVQVESKAVPANESIMIYSPVKTRYVQFAVDSFDSTPCHLQTQAFFF